MHTSNYLFVVFLSVAVQVHAQNLPQYISNIRDCFYTNSSIICVKERTLDILNQTIYSEEPINLFNSIYITRNKDYLPQHMKEVVPFETSQRSLILTEAIRNKIEEFFMSRLIQVRIGDAVEARKKGGGIFGGGGGGGGGKKGGGGGMLILIGVAMAGVLTQLFMGKIALAAGAALLLAKIALTVTLVSSFKKTSNNGGGKESAHVVYAPGGSDGYSHGYGGWHRSMVYEEDPQKIAYNGYAQQSAQYH